MTTFPISTTSDLWPVHVIGMGGEPRARNDADGRPKVAPSGEATYMSGTILIVARDGIEGPQKSASVHVLKPAATYVMGERYMARGRVWVQPYEANGRVAQSITVEELVPARQAQPQTKGE